MWSASPTLRATAMAFNSNITSSFPSGNGFTLIELLVVMTIVATLSAFAVPHYQSYRERSFDLRAQFDLRSVAIAEEAHFLDEEQYLSCQNAQCEHLPGIARLSDGVQLTITAADTSFTGKASHPKGSGKEFHWDSERGGLINTD